MAGVGVLLRYVVAPLVILGALATGFGFIVDRSPKLAAGLVAIVFLTAAVAFVAARLRFRRRGYRSYRFGRDLIRYEERNDGELRALTLDGEMLVKRPHLVRVPTGTAWDKGMPQWAHGRRDEILARIKEELGTTEYHYVVADA